MRQQPKPRWLPEPQTLRLLTGLQQHPSLLAAAQAIGMPQPNATRAMTKLETEFGMKLVARSPAGTTLTPEGVALAKVAEKVLAGYAELEDTVHQLGVTQQQPLLLAASFAIGEQLLPGWIREVRQRVKNAEVRAHLMNPKLVCEAVASGAVELGFTETEHAPTSQNKHALTSEVIARDEMWLVVPPGHPWAKPGFAVRRDELAATTLITRDIGSASAVTARVKNENTPAKLSAGAARGSVESGELVRVHTHGFTLEHTVWAVWRTAELSTLAQLAIRTAQNKSSRQALE